MAGLRARLRSGPQDGALSSEHAFRRQFRHGWTYSYSYALFGAAPQPTGTESAQCLFIIEPETSKRLESGNQTLNDHATQSSGASPLRMGPWGRRQALRGRG